MRELYTAILVVGWLIALLVTVGLKGRRERFLGVIALIILPIACLAPVVTGAVNRAAEQRLHRVYRTLDFLQEVEELITNGHVSLAKAQLCEFRTSYPSQTNSIAFRDLMFKLERNRDSADPKPE